MKINHMDLSDLAAFAVTLPDWEWRKAIVDIDGDMVESVTPRSRIVMDGFIHDVEGFGGCHPDLNDAATKGCVMGMVRKKFGEHTYTLYTPRGWQVMVHEGYRIRCVVKSSEEMKTEIHAMIAALAK